MRPLKGNGGTMLVSDMPRRTESGILSSNVAKKSCGDLLLPNDGKMWPATRVRKVTDVVAVGPHHLSKFRRGTSNTIGISPSKTQ